MAREEIFYGEVLDEATELSLVELCRACEITAEQLLAFVEEGIVEPLGRHPGNPGRWRFEGLCIQRVRCAIRLQKDLQVNRAGAAVILDLLDELHALRRRLGV